MKPADTWTRFTGQVIETLEALEVLMDRLGEDVRVWVSDLVEFVAEYRAYALDGFILGICPYAGPEWLEGSPEPWVNRDVIEAGLDAMSHHSRALVIDHGVLASGETVLVEMNDAWAIGLYPGISRTDYLSLLTARWQELVAGSVGVG